MRNSSQANAPTSPLILQRICSFFISLLCLSTPLFSSQKGTLQTLPEIKIGLSAALSGPTKNLGLNIKLGIETYFQQVNEHGGVSGRSIRLIALDDGYVPERARKNMIHLIDEEKVLAVAGNVGTPTAAATVPIANEKKTLLFGAYSGAGLLRRNPPDRYVINYRASYAEETSAMIKGLLAQGIRPVEIAFFSQRDQYGDAGYQGAVEALKQSGFLRSDQLIHGRYTRNDTDIEEGLLSIVDSRIKPKAIIMVGTYQPCAKFIRIAKQVLLDTYFLNVSFVGSTALNRALKEKGEGVFVTQVVPHFNAELPITIEYREAMKQFAPEADLGFVSLEGYILAKILVQGCIQAGNTLNRESLIDALEQFKDLDIGLEDTVTLSRTSHQASHKVWMTKIQKGRYIPVEWNY